MLKKDLFPFFLTLLVLILSLLNYQPGTWLSGWDTLHPEFNFTLNFSRVLSGVWRQEQGLGAVAAHSQMADLPRLILLLPLSLIFPISSLRYFYIFLNLILGPLGVYFFLEKIIFRNQDGLKKVAAFLGSLFYLLNLGTLQHFYVPFEMFTTQFAALGWLFLFASLFIKSGNHKFIWFFSLTTFLATPMAYAATLWYVYFLAFFLYLFFFSVFLKTKNISFYFKRVLFLLGATLIINSYWLLPNLYFLKNHAQEVPQAKINRLFSEEAFLNNQEFGDLKNVAILRNFLFNWQEYGKNGQFVMLLDEWARHLKKPFVLSIGYAIFALIIFGIILAIWRKEKGALAILPVFCLALIFLLNNTFPVDKIFLFLQNNLPLFREILRFPFTKFSLLLVLTEAVFLAISLNFFGEYFLNLIKKERFVVLCQVILVTFLLTYFMWPAFKGNLVSPSLRIKIPQRYFALFAWFKSQPDKGRIAVLPLHSFWGWEYHDWTTTSAGPSFQGAGFLWFGIKQPLLVRDFDRWNQANEEFYREISYAVYANNLNLFEKILEKYQIRYLLLDKSIIAPGKEVDPKILYFGEIEKLLASSGKIKLAKSFGFGLDVYQTDLKTKPQDFVYFLADFAQVEPRFAESNFDQAYADLGPYVTQMKDSLPQNLAINSFHYPFRNIFAAESVLPKRLEIIKNKFRLTADRILESWRLSLPNYPKIESVIGTKVFLKKESGLTLRLVFNLPKFWGSNTQNPEIKLAPPPSLIYDARFLSFGGGEVFNIGERNENEEAYLGEVILETQKENLIFFYGPPPFPTQTLLVDQIALFPENCQKPKEDQFFGREKRSEDLGFELIARNTLACVTLPVLSFTDFSTLSWEKDKEVLLNLTFEYQANQKVKPQFAFLDSDRNQYLKSSVFAKSQFNDEKKVSHFLAIKAADLPSLQLRFFLDAQKSFSEKRILYKNISLSFSPSLGQIAVTPERLSDAFSGLKNSDALADFNIIEGELLPLADSNFEITRADHQAEICGDLLPQFYDRQIKEKMGQSYIEYSSLKGASCDHFSYPNLSQKWGYLLAVESRNVYGLPLRICLANNFTRRCDLYTALTSNKEFTRELFLLPPRGQVGSGYDVNINNYSVGKIKSINDLKSITFYLFPYNWIFNLRQESFLLRAPRQSPQASPQASLTKALNSTFYLVKGVTTPNHNASLLVLDQSFEKNWQAYLFASSFIPKAIKPHVLVNNWANGWRLKPNTEGTIILVFWPQYLEYLGFFLLAVFFGFYLKSDWPSLKKFLRQKTRLW